MSDRGWGDEHPKILNVSTMKNNGGCGFTEADIEETIKWWANKASPVTNAPSHPDRHDATEKAKASNRFNVLAESERKEHSLLTGSFPKFVYTVLTSKVGKAAWKYLFEAREPRRVTFSVPQTAKKFGLKGFYFQRGEIVGEDKDAGGALLIVDVDGQGNLNIQTGYPTKDTPPDAGKTAGAHDCYYRPGDNILVIDDGGDKLRSEQVGGTTIFEGKKTERYL